MQSKLSYSSGYVTGTTTASYVTIAKFDTRGCGYQGKTHFILTNAAASKAMLYKITGYLGDPTTEVGTPIVLKAETSIAASAAVDNVTYIVTPYAAVVFEVKNDDGVTTYSLEWCTL
jgi:hypothetical protein